MSLWQSWFAWPNGGVWSNLVASAITFGLGYLVAAWHFKCVHCWRPGRVPVKGTVHHVCRRHAVKHGHTH